jgi:hypothetical protein
MGLVCANFSTEQHLGGARMMPPPVVDRDQQSRSSVISLLDLQGYQA